MLPVVLVTALDPAQERVKGLEAGADDFLSKPVNQAELLARVRSLLRIKTLYDEVQRQKGELAELEPHARAARGRRRARSSSGWAGSSASSRRSWPRRSSPAAPTIR